jgi:hypothetical protein
MAHSVQKFILLAAVVYGTAATAQEAIQLLEPGIGYSRLKKWVAGGRCVPGAPRSKPSPQATMARVLLQTLDPVAFALARSPLSTQRRH